MATVIDLFSRKVIGWAISKRMTVKIAITNERPGAGLIFHSDRGSQVA